MKSKSQLMGWGVVMGASVGVALGVAAGHIAIWIAIGLVIGMALGSTMRRKETSCPQCAVVHRIHEERKLTSHELAARS